MRWRIASALIALAVLASQLAGCVPALGARKPTVVNVAFVSYPGGGASPEALSLYKAALAITKANAGEYELKISTITPSINPALSAQQDPPAVSALEQALGQNPPPDVVLFSSWYELSLAVEKELVAPLDEVARSERSFKLDDYFPGTIDAVSDQGRIYALPLSAMPMVLQYDKRLFDEAGLGAPDANWSWSTLLSAATQLTKADSDFGPQWGLNAMAGNWLPVLIWQNGGEFVTKDGRRSLLGEPAAVEAIRYYYDLMYRHKVAATASNQGAAAAKAMAVTKQAFRPGDYPPLMGPGGRIAMQPVPGSAMAYNFKMAGSGEQPIQIAELPRGKQQATLVEVQTSLALTSVSANPRVAFKALNALAAEMQSEMTVPSSRTAAKRFAQTHPTLDEEDAKVLLAAMENGRSLPLYRQGYYTRVLYEKLIGPLTQGNKQPEDAAAETAQAIDEVLNKPLEELQASQTGG